MPLCHPRFERPLRRPGTFECLRFQAADVLWRDAQEGLGVAHGTGCTLPRLPVRAHHWQLLLPLYRCLRWARPNPDGRQVRHVACCDGLASPGRRFHRLDAIERRREDVRGDLLPIQPSRRFHQDQRRGELCARRGNRDARVRWHPW